MTDVDDDDPFADEDEDLEDDDRDRGNRRGSSRGQPTTANAVLDYLVRALVEEPDAVDIDTDDGRRGVSLRVRVAQGDMGRVIGKRGRTANAIRTIVRAAAVKDNVDVDVDFVD